MQLTKVLNKYALQYRRLILLFAGLGMLFLYSCRTPSVISKHPGPAHSTADNSFYATYSTKLGIKLNCSEDRKLIREVSDWIGTPYKYGGSDRNGTDCSGFIMSVYKKVYHIELYRSATDQVKNTDPVAKRDLECGDLVFFKISGNQVSHVGLYIADNKFVHASSKRGVVVNDLDEDYYKKYYYSAGRVKSVMGNK
jgi:lipoprotein Spr/probable lipoprotein NlpC